MRAPRLEQPADALRRDAAKPLDEDFILTSGRTSPVPGADHPGCERAATRARSARPAAVTLPRTRRPSYQRAAFPRRPGNSRADTRDTRPAQRCTSSQETPAGAARPWPSAERPTVRTDRPGGPDAVRYTSVDTATHRPAVTQADTCRDTKETARRATFPQPAGRFPWWWQVLGSNQRRLSRRFYRPLLPAPPHNL